jgi:hypothetical protein
VRECNRPSGLRWGYRPIFERARKKSNDFEDLFAKQRKDFEALKR